MNNIDHQHYQQLADWAEATTATSTPIGHYKDPQPSQRPTSCCTLPAQNCAGQTNSKQIIGRFSGRAHGAPVR